MDFMNEYYANLLTCLECIQQQKSAIKKAAKLMSEAQQAGGSLYAFGTGHSHMVAQEVYARAGGYAKIYPITEIEMTLLTDPMKSTMVEREASYANVLESLYPLKDGDVLIAISNSGRNPLVVEYVQRMKAKGVKIIAITSLAHTNQVTSRHESGLKLFELADVVLDNCAPFNDATTAITENAVMGPVSSITGMFIIQNLVGEMVANLVEAGVEVPVFRSSNGDGADEYNQVLFDKYIYGK